MKKLLVTALAILTAFNVFASQYEFDESFTLVEGEYTFVTSFKEQTELDLIDLQTGMSYMQREGFDVFKANMNVDFKFWNTGHPFAFFSYDDSLDYKRVGAGYEQILRAIKNEAGYKLFDHKASIAALYDSKTGDTTISGRYKAKVSIPYSEYSSREMIGADALVQMSGFGEKYKVGAEYRMNEQLSIFGNYTNERVLSNRDEVIKQGIRIRI